MSAAPGVCCGVQETGDVCGTPARHVDLGVQRRMERVVSGDEGPGAQEGMEGCGTGVGMGHSEDLWVLGTGVVVRMDESKGTLCCLVCVWLREEKGTGLHPYGEGLPRLE